MHRSWTYVVSIIRAHNCKVLCGTQGHIDVGYASYGIRQRIYVYNRSLAEVQGQFCMLLSAIHTIEPAVAYTQEPAIKHIRQPRLHQQL